jgi:hypothetical protein
MRYISRPDERIRDQVLHRGIVERIACEILHPIDDIVDVGGEVHSTGIDVLD